MMRNQEQNTAPDPRDRLIRDLEVIGRMGRNDRAPAAERLTTAIGRDLFQAVRLSLLAPDADASQRAPNRAA